MDRELQLIGVQKVAIKRNWGKVGGVNFFLEKKKKVES